MAQLVRDDGAAVGVPIGDGMVVLDRAHSAAEGEGLMGRFYAKFPAVEDGKWLITPGNPSGYAFDVGGYNVQIEPPTTSRFLGKDAHVWHELKWSQPPAPPTLILRPRWGSAANPSARPDWYGAGDTMLDHEQGHINDYLKVLQNRQSIDFTKPGRGYAKYMRDTNTLLNVCSFIHTDHQRGKSRNIPGVVHPPKVTPALRQQCKQMGLDWPDRPRPSLTSFSDIRDYVLGPSFRTDFRLVGQSLGQSYRSMFKIKGLREGLLRRPGGSVL